MLRFGLGRMGLASIDADAFNPISLFANGEQGYIYDVNTLSSLFQNSNGTTAVAVATDPIGRISDLSPRGNHAIQAASGKRPLLGVDGPAYYAAGDGTDDFLRSLFTITQPITRISLLTQEVWNGAQIVGGGSANSALLYQNPGTSEVALYAGTADPSKNTYQRFVLDGATLITEVHSGASSGIGCGFDPLTPTSIGANAPGGVTFFANNSDTTPANARLYSSVEINRLLTATETANVKKWMMRPWTRVVVAEGDSVTYANPVNGGFLYIARPNLSPQAFLINNAYGGSRLATNAAFGTYPYLDSSSGPGDLIYRSAYSDAVIPTSKGGVKYIFWVYIGTNDSPDFPLQAAWIAQLQGYCLARRAAGFDNIVVGTLLPRSDAAYSTHNARRATLNPLIRTMVSNNGFTLCDFAAEPTMGVDGASDNLTYYSDKIHPTVAGNALLEPIYRAAINSI